MSETPTTIAELRIAADPERWADCGFAVERGLARIGTTPVRFTGASEDGRGAIAGWTLSGGEATDLDGLVTERGAAPDGGTAEHPNGALQIDHIVVFTPELERTIDAFESSGVPCRRVREVGPPDRLLRQAFFRFGEVICEVVEVPLDQAGVDGASRFWGLTVTIADLDRAVAELGEGVGTIRDAVQPGRRIATFRGEAGLGIPVALITPEPPRSSDAD